MPTSIDDNAADEKSDKPKCPLLIIHCTSYREATYNKARMAEVGMDE